MAKSRRKKAPSAWKRGFNIYKTVLFVIFAGALILLWISLAKYQRSADEETLTVSEVKVEETSAKDGKEGGAENDTEEASISSVSEERAAQECFQQYLSEMDEGDWVRVWKENHPLSFDSDEDIARLIRSRLTDKGFEQFRLEVPDGEAPAFILKTDDGIMATFTLSGADGSYKVAGIKLEPEGTEKVRVVAAEGIHVMLNGVLVPDAEMEILEPENEAPVPDYEEKLNGRIGYRSFEAEGLIAAPVISAESDSETYAVSEDTEGRYVYILKEEGKYRDRAEAFIKALLNFYANGKTDAEAHMNAALSHVAGGSKAGTTIYAALDGVQWKTPDHVARYETETSDVYVLSENCYAVDVRYTDMGLSEPVTECYRVYFLDTGKGFNIVQFAMGELGRE